jgi:hypothetical protein
MFSLIQVLPKVVSHLINPRTFLRRKKLSVPFSILCEVYIGWVNLVGGVVKDFTEPAILRVWFEVF